MPQVLTDASGNYVFADLPEGQYRIDVIPPDGYRDAPDQTISVLDGQTVQVDPFRLAQKVGAASGSVVDSSGNPLAGVAVVATRV